MLINITTDGAVIVILDFIKIILENALEKIYRQIVGIINNMTISSNYACVKTGSIELMVNAKHQLSVIKLHIGMVKNVNVEMVM